MLSDSQFAAKLQLEENQSYRQGQQNNFQISEKQKQESEDEKLAKLIADQEKKKKQEEEDLQLARRLSNENEVQNRVYKPVNVYPDHFKWQFLNDSNYHEDFPIGASKCVEKIYQGYLQDPNMSKLTGVTIVIAGKKYAINFQKMIQTNLNERKNKRNIRRISIGQIGSSGPIPPKNESSKRFQFYDNSWKNLDVASSKALEFCFNERTKNPNMNNGTLPGVTILINSHEYYVNFDTLKQKNLSTETQRNLRRVNLF